MTDTQNFNKQFTVSQQSYLAGLDLYTWTRHFYIIKSILKITKGDIFEVGTGDGVVRRCVEPFVQSYTVLDVNPALSPDVHADVRDRVPELIQRFDAAIAAEILEHIPFSELQACLNNLWHYLRPGGFLLLTLPHRKGHMMFVTPRQVLWNFRFPIGLTSLSEAYNRIIRRRIWIDPNHCWEIGDGTVRPSHIKNIIKQQGWKIQSFEHLPYCDYWLLHKPTQ